MVLQMSMMNKITHTSGVTGLFLVRFKHCVDTQNTQLLGYKMNTSKQVHVLIVCLGLICLFL